jgi:hypothetical protein
MVDFNYTVTNAMSTEEIQQVLNNKEIGIVSFKPGIYRLKASLKVDRSDIVLEGNGCTLIIDDHVNEPNISVGTRNHIPSDTDEIRNITINNFLLDGNRANQDSEYSMTQNWIRNNNIDARKVSGLNITNCTMKSARSGGFVISWNCSDVSCNNCTVYDQYYDAFALYTSHSCIVTNFVAYDCDGAGISLDNSITDTIFSNGIIRNCKDVGVFVRDAIQISFSNLMISGCSSHGIFLGDNYETKRGPIGITINGCTVRSCGGVAVKNGATILGKHLSLMNSVLGPNKGGNLEHESSGNKLQTAALIQFIR